MDWTTVLTAIGVVAAIVAAGFAVGRNEWNRSTMDAFHTANDELRSDNEGLRDRVEELKKAVEAEHSDCERRLNDEVAKWTKTVGQLEGQISMIQTEQQQTFLRGMREEVLTVVHSAVEEATGPSRSHREKDR